MTAEDSGSIIGIDSWEREQYYSPEYPTAREEGWCCRVVAPLVVSLGCKIIKNKRMKKIKQLEAYTSASLAIAAFKKKNAKVFGKYEELLLEASNAESELKKYAKEEKSNFSNDIVNVTYSPAFKKYYDTETVLQMATTKMKKALIAEGAIVIEQKIDTKKFVEMVEEGIVPREIQQEAFRETELAPRVIIKEKK